MIVDGFALDGNHAANFDDQFVAFAANRIGAVAVNKP